MEKLTIFLWSKSRAPSPWSSGTDHEIRTQRTWVIYSSYIAPLVWTRWTLNVNFNVDKLYYLLFMCCVSISRPTPIQPNHTQILHATDPPPVVLYNQTAVSSDEYVRRLRVSERQVTLHSVRMMDEGSFTVLDREGKVRRRNCLNVRGGERSVLQLPASSQL